MFNYVRVNFPTIKEGPQFLYSATLLQDRYKHEEVVLVFKDWDVVYDSITTNSPIVVDFKGTYSRRTFYGYIHAVVPYITPGKNYVEVRALGPSSTMTQSTQTVYKNITADQVVKKIAAKHGFVCNAVPHPRVYDQISQAGRSDWALMVKLAKQCGYSLRAENTELYFQPMLEDFTKYRSESRTYVLRRPEDINATTIYSFTPIIGEALEFEDAMKAAVAVSGVEPYSKSPIRVTNKRNKKTRKKQKPELYDHFATTVVADDPSIAKYEAEAAENRNSFPYRAEVEVLGEPDLRPDFPVFLQGVGESYSGFWTILGTEHRIVETDLNEQTYTTVLHVGTDALGTSVPWTDNKVIEAPEDLPARTIIPNVRQTKVIPKTTLLNQNSLPYPQAIVESTSVQNRAGVSGLVSEFPTWKSNTASLNNIVPEVRKSPAVVQRLKKKGLL